MVNSLGSLERGQATDPTELPHQAARLPPAQVQTASSHYSIGLQLIEDEEREREGGSDRLSSCALFGALFQLPCVFDYFNTYISISGPFTTMYRHWYCVLLCLKCVSLLRIDNIYICSV